MKFRKKPVVVEAIQYTEENCRNGSLSRFCDCLVYDQKGKLYIDTLEGDMLVSLNDWVIQGVNGEFYPCKPDIFKKTYEEIK